MAASKTQSRGLALIEHFLGKGMDYWNRVYEGHTGIIHMYLTLYNLFSKRRLSNVELNLS